MTAQIPEILILDGKRFDLCGVRGEGLFEPTALGLETEAPHASCRRGFFCCYAVECGRLLLAELDLWTSPKVWKVARKKLIALCGGHLDFDEKAAHVKTRNLDLHIRFTGGLLLGFDFIEDLSVTIGFQPAHTYRQVVELIFEDGVLVSRVDRSTEMEAVRARETIADQDRSKDLVAWIDDRARTDY